MSETNERTIAAYDTHVNEYMANTPTDLSETSKEWLAVSLKGLKTSARILEIGSAFGHDAAYIEQQGYKVDRTDASQSFVDHLQAQGHNAKKLNVLTDEITGPYNLVFADSVFHHFTISDALIASTNIFNSLDEEGRFAASLRLGLEEGWSEEKMGIPRYFSHWDRPNIEEIVREVGFISFIATDGHKPKFPWLHFVARK